MSNTDYTDAEIEVCRKIARAMMKEMRRRQLETAESIGQASAKKMLPHYIARLANEVQGLETAISVIGSMELDTIADVLRETGLTKTR